MKYNKIDNFIKSLVYNSDLISDIDNLSDFLYEFIPKEYKIVTKLFTISNQDFYAIIISLDINDMIVMKIIPIGDDYFVIEYVEDNVTSFYEVDSTDGITDFFNDFKLL